MFLRYFKYYQRIRNITAFRKKKASSRSSARTPSVQTEEKEVTTCYSKEQHGLPLKRISFDPLLLQGIIMAQNGIRSIMCFSDFISTDTNTNTHTHSNNSNSNNSIIVLIPVIVTLLTYNFLFWWILGNLLLFSFFSTKQNIKKTLERKSNMPEKSLKGIPFDGYAKKILSVVAVPAKVSVWLREGKIDLNNLLIRK